MNLRYTLAVVTALMAFPATGFADGIEISDAYARSASPAAKTGAAFMMIANSGAQDDRLIAVQSPAAKRVELHTHIDAGNGVLQMREVESGFEIPAGGMHELARGGDHVMLMGLTAPLTQGATIVLTLTFEQAGDMQIEVPVDLARQAGGHGATKHGDGS